MAKCIENKPQVLIQYKSHVMNMYVTSFHYLGFPFLNNQQNILNYNLIYNC